MDPNTLNWGEIAAGGAAILSALLGAIKLLMVTSNKPIHQKIDRLQKETTERFDCISVTLAIVEDNTVRKGIIDALRSATRGYIHFNKVIDSKTKILIDGQCERIVEITEEMMAEKFTHDMVDQMEVKLEEAAQRGRLQAQSLFGDEFLSYYVVLQTNAVKDYLDMIKGIADDQVVNSKYARFKVATEHFLHTLIGETIILTHKWEKKEKCVKT